MILMDKEESTQDKFIRSLMAEKAQAEADRKAVIEEFTRTVPKEWSPDDLKDKMRELLAEAYARIRITINNDDEPGLAFQASKYVMSIGVGQIKISDANDPNKELNELLKNLQKDKKSPSDTKTTN